MQHKNKACTIAIMTVLTLSMVLAAIPMASAITTISLSSYKGSVETVVTVSGTGATPGLTVEVYWDAVVPWDGVRGYLNETTALGDGTFEVQVTIPEATAGTHWIIAFDVTSSTSLGANFTVTPNIDITPKSGLPGDTVTVDGTGFAATSDVSIYFGNTTTETDITLSGLVGNGTSSTVYNITGSLTYAPVMPTSVNITLTFNTTTTFSYPSYLSVYDDGTGGLYGVVTDTDAEVNGTGTINYADGSFNITLNVNVTENIWVWSPANAIYLRSLTTDPATTATTSSLGSFTASFTVPTVANGNYTVRAIDASGNFAEALFAVGPTITLTLTEGPTGTVVSISGRGFSSGENITVAMDGTTAPLVANITVATDGTFTGEFIVPMLSLGTYAVNASGEINHALADFDVTGVPAITVSPGFGVPGDTISVEGVNFTQIEGTQVTVTLNTTTPTTVGTFTTNATGGFAGTFTVPAVSWATYTLNATDAYNLTATTTFVVGMVYAVLSPSEGPTGTNVTATGTGFTANATVNGTLNGILVFSGSVGSDGTFSETFIVPTVPVGTYTVTIMDAEGVTFETSFTVTETTTIIVTPSAAPVGYNVTVEGLYFTALADQNVTITLKNATWSLFLVNATTNATGGFMGNFTVPSEASLGDYVINATDINGLTAEVPFSIVTITVEMYTRATEYLQGDTVSFYIKSTFAYNVTITIEDPTGYPATVSILVGDWLLMGDFQVVPYGQAVFVLPSDAVLGAWSWTATIGTETEIGGFTVVEKPTLSMILDRLDELDVKLSGLITDAEGNVKAYIDSSLGPVIASLDDINATIINIQNSIATINSTIGEIKVSVDDIHLKVVAINGTVATIETDLGTLQGTVTSIDDNVATIVIPDLGEVKADVSDITEKGVTVDLTPVWIAVVLSLIAAIAACYTVITIHRKIAG